MACSAFASDFIPQTLRPTMSTPPHLTTHALIAQLNIKTFGNHRKDERLTDDVHLRNGMAAEAGAYQKVLLPKACLKPLEKIVSAARADHRQQTLMTPFGPILPATRVDAFTATMSKWRDTWTAAKNHFISDYEGNIAIARDILGRAFDPAAYPQRSELHDIFAFQVTLSPLPKPAALDDIIGLADARLAQLRREIDDTTQAAARAARAELLERLFGRLERVFHMLANPDASVHTRTLESLAELLHLAPQYNLTNDPLITRLVADCNRTLTLAKDAIKDSPIVRARTASAAEVLLTHFGRSPRKITLPSDPKPAAQVA